ncbi:TetR/AcrR family transcriptional regulator [Actinacidiphila acidipaludis]|uniref:WHG domain-containing protein n=1 Tax=Actinacidiphila acidipaludis TaxID=2873382 RepID=A0ABS7Q2N1_9ACTN|nr:TetR/AcrR family transcriptional regulator [Streptomyces acidipaludis]MBY8877390.1 WHG domain-containing protein [Streptomyces acidipaludis]
MAGKQGYHHGNLPQALVDAGLTLARAGGPGAIGLREVSRQAGVSHNAAYRHYADHHELVAAVAARCMDRLGALMRARTEAVTGPPGAQRAWARLNALGRAYVDFARAEPGWFRTAFTGAGVGAGTEGGEGVQLPADHPFRQLNAALDDLVDAGALPHGRREGAEYAAWSSVHGLAALLVDGPLQHLPESEVRRALDTVLAVVTRGL